MKIVNAVKSGFFRSCASWKFVMVIWFAGLSMVSFLVIPVKGALKAGFGDSTITEKLLKGIDIDVISDLGPSLKTIFSFFSSGLLLITIAVMIVSIFLKGGLFGSLKGSSEKFPFIQFFRESAANFWSFLVISIVLNAVLCVLAVVVFVIPAVIIISSGNISEPAAFAVIVSCVVILLLMSVVLMIVADYARAWQVAAEKQACFTAIGFGLSRTFHNFSASVSLMLIIMTVQVFYVFLTFEILSTWIPEKGSGVFLLFIISQVLFYGKVMLKTWRYASVTSLMEQGLPATDVASA